MYLCRIGLIGSLIEICVVSTLGIELTVYRRKNEQYGSPDVEFELIAQIPV